MGAKSIIIRSLHEYDKNVKLEKVLCYYVGSDPNPKPRRRSVQPIRAAL